MRRRVVATGIGIYCSLGSNIEQFWKNCLDGKSRVSPIPEHWNYYADFNSKIWSPLSPWEDDNVVTRVDRLHYDPVSLNGFCAALEAFESAGFTIEAHSSKRRRWTVPNLDPQRAGVFMGTGIGGAVSFLSNYSSHLLARNKANLNKVKKAIASTSAIELLDETLDHLECRARLSPFVVSMGMPNAVSAVLGLKFSLNGPNSTHSLACASSTVAIGNAFQAIRDGEVDLAVTGGSEYSEGENGSMFRGYDSAGTLVHGYDDPFTANRPFDNNRSGFLFSQGGSGVLILESLDHAQARGAEILAEVIGFAETFDGYSMMSIEEGGDQIEYMIRKLLNRSSIDAPSVGYINSHGTGTINNDKIESDVIGRVFGQSVWVNSTKSLLGHTLGASGAIEAIVTILSLKHQTTHACNNLENPISSLNFVLDPGQKIDAKFGLSQSFAFGGHNAALLFQKHT